MDLPLDHFRLLGVNPATDAQTVLRTLQLRLDRAPDQGYTAETLQARADLLRASADLLSNGERRAAYESDLTALAAADEPLMPALEIPFSREVAGLLLLLEAGQPLDSFNLASRCLQPPQAPALGSGREADLTRLAGEAALAAASDYSQDRHYELAARTLQQGLQLLQRMGQLPALREKIHSELDALSPFRVLDLISRDPSAGQERQEGLALLEQLVQRRGGLEGTADDGFAPEDFQTFFKQIRTFLTVQEQIDLFERWGRQGSPAADFLGTIALTASGFAQRKPERIAAARERLRVSGREGIEPLLANLDLLLGDVEGATQRFATGAGTELRGWAARQSSDPLAQVCAWCRDWLGRDVLPGYRDLDADADLEAFFSDRDVLAWVEREDRRNGRAFAAAPDSGALAAGTEFTLEGNGWPAPIGGPGLTGTTSSDPFGLGLGGGSSGGLAGAPWEPAPTAAPIAGGRQSRRRSHSEAGDHGTDDGEQEAPPDLGLDLSFLNWRTLTKAPVLASVAGLGVLLMLGSWLLRPRPPEPAKRPAPAVAVAPAQPVGTAMTPPAMPRPAGQAAPAGSPPADGTAPPRPASGPSPAQAAVAVAPLRVAEPSEAEVRGLLDLWLQAKTAVMGGAEPSAELDQLARGAPVQRLTAERAQDRARGRTQSIQAQVASLAIQQRSPQRIEVVAELRYSDSTRDSAGKEVDRTPATTLRNIYVFGRDGDTWRLAASRPAR